MTNAEKDKAVSRLAEQAMLLRCLQILLKSFGQAARAMEGKEPKTVEQKERETDAYMRALRRVQDISVILVDNAAIPTYSEEDKF
jgi:hypothetical protein